MDLNVLPSVKIVQSEQLQAYFQKGDLRQSSTAAHDEEAEETTSDDDHISNRMVINKFNSLQTFITGQFQSLGTSINIFQNFETILAQNHELMLNELNGLILKIDQLHDPKDDNLQFADEYEFFFVVLFVFTCFMQFYL